METCNDIGQVVNPDPTALCNVFLNSPIVFQQSALLSSYVGWKDLALTSCALLDTTKTLCFRVDTSGGSQRIAAATAVVGLEFIQGGARRRLLSSSMEDIQERKVQHMLWDASWDAMYSSTVCIALVQAFRASSSLVSVVDRHTLKQCLHWRMAANSTLEMFGIQDVSDQFILSTQGLAYAWMQPSFLDGFLVQHFPQALLYLVSHAEWAEPLVQVVENLQVLNTTFAHVQAFLSTRNNTHLQKSMARVQAMTHTILPFMQSAHTSSYFQKQSMVFHAALNDSRTTDSIIASKMTTNRRLLATNLANVEGEKEVTWKDTLDEIPSTIAMVQAYSSLVAAGAYKTALLPSELANAWKSGPFTFPESLYSYTRNGENNCPAGKEAVQVILGTFKLLQWQYANIPAFGGKTLVSSSFPIIHQTQLEDALHVNLPLGPLGSWPIEVSKDDVWMGSFVGFLTGNTTEQGWTASRLLKETFQCNFEKVIVKCRENQKSTLVTGTAAILLMLALLYIAFGSILYLLVGVIFITTLILWNVYGYSPACFPMVPPCILEDMLAIFQWLFPLQLQWPLALQRTPNCAFNASIAVQDCFLSCKVRLMSPLWVSCTHLFTSFAASYLTNHFCRIHPSTTTAGRRQWHGSCATGIRCGAPTQPFHGHRRTLGCSSPSALWTHLYKRETHCFSRDMSLTKCLLMQKGFASPLISFIWFHTFSLPLSSSMESMQYSSFPLLSFKL